MFDGLIGNTIANHYRFDAMLGEGTFARVYRVHDTRRNVDLAAKLLRTDMSADESTFIERFRREGAVLERLRHPHIVRYYDLIEWEQYTFILMEFVPGETLQKTLYSLGRPFSIAETLTFLKPLTAALQFAHSEGVIHRDLKPANILLHEKGNILVSDFGIARLLDEHNISHGDNAMGTPLYMAPEQIRGVEITPATDIYALGVLLYQMVTGTVPFLGRNPLAQGKNSSEKIIYEHLFMPPPPPHQYIHNLPEAVEQVILRCMFKKTEERFQTVRDVYDYFSEAVGAEPYTPSDAEKLQQSDTVPPPAPYEVSLPEISQFVYLTRHTVDLQIPLETREKTWLHVRYNSPPQMQAMQDIEAHLADTLPRGLDTPTIPRVYTPAEAKANNSTASLNRVSVSRPFSAWRWRLVLIGLSMGGVVALVLVGIWFGVYLLSASEEAPPQNPAIVAPTVTDDGDRPDFNNPSNIYLHQNGDYIVYSAPNVSGSGMLGLYLFNVNTREKRSLFEDDRLNATGAVWSPNGTQLAFYAYDEDTFKADIYVMDLEGTLLNLTNSPQSDDRNASWSPDGQKLLFCSDRPGQDGGRDYELYIMDLDTNETQQITNNAVPDLGPDWSPNGEQIVYHRYDGNQTYVYLMRIADDLFFERRPFTPDTLPNAAAASWSPDGTRLVFHAADGNGYFQIYIINADGSGLRPLLEEYFNDQNASWSPDGQYILFQREKDSEVGIYRYALATGEVEVILPPDGESQPAWQPIRLN